MCGECSHLYIWYAHMCGECSHLYICVMLCISTLVMSVCSVYSSMQRVVCSVYTQWYVCVQWMCVYSGCSMWCAVYSIQCLHTVYLVCISALPHDTDCVVIQCSLCVYSRSQSVTEDVFRCVSSVKRN